MAIQITSHKPLDPFATPYQKKPSTNFFIYTYPNPPPLFYVLHPQFPTYNVPLKTKTKPKALPISTPKPPKNDKSCLLPVPSGPRNTKPPVMKWRVKVTEKKDLVEKKNRGFERKRWKNSCGEYEKSLPLEGNTTSVMIKNVPNKYTRKLLIQTLDNHCEGEKKKGFVSAFDFIYLPIDFKSRNNAGFAFVNFTTSEAALRFRDAFNGKKWNCFESGKVAEISRARIQGKVALVNNCKGMNFAFGSEEDMPVWFAPARGGSGEVESKMYAVGKCWVM